MNAEDLRSLADCSRFLRGLGYAASLTPVSRDAWPNGLPAPAGRWWYGGSFGSLDVHIIEAEDAIDGEQTLRSLVSWNAVRSHALIQVAPEQTRILLGRYGRRTSSLRIHPQQRRDDLAQRLAILHRTVDDRRDPAELFGRAMESDSTGRRFFERFRRAVGEVAGSIRESTRDQAAACDDEALLVMSRLLFLRFVEKKGWLDGDPGFLRRHFAATTGSLWKSFLEPLFFGCLNQPFSRRRGSAVVLGRIPYLNGGLFERSSFERRHPQLEISDEALRLAFDEVFDLFEFSVSEDTEDVTSIDPEMLGRVFESLMEQDERADSGTFYTPPPVVDRVVIGAIAERLGVDAAEREALVAIMNGGSAKIGRRRGGEIARAARELRIIDPACGTGAFLLSALHQLELLSKKLTNGAPTSRRFIVENQLYGIDRKREAVRLCELRMWLAVVASESCDSRDVQPLPNLDRNIAQGDTLVSPLDFGRQLSDATGAAVPAPAVPEIAEYRRSSGTERSRYRRLLARREQARAIAILDAARASADAAPSQQTIDGRIEGDRTFLQKIARLRREISRGELPFFDWRVTFAEVADRGGFDVVAGNPPWVRHSRIDPAIRKLLTARYSWFAGHGKGFRQADLYIPFLQRALELSRDRGVVAMLVPAKLLTAGYASVARRDLLRVHRLRALQRMADDAFDADTFPLQLRVVKDGPDGSVVEVEEGEADPRMIGGCREDGPWLLAPDRVLRTLRSMENRFPPLSAQPALQPRMGVKTGDNALFIRPELQPAGDASWSLGGVTLPPDAVVVLMRGRDLHGLEWSDGVPMLWPPGLARLDRRALQRLARHLGTDAARLFRFDSNVHDTANAVAWKDLAQRLEPSLLPPHSLRAGRRIRVIPNQTLYLIRASTQAQACVIEAVLGSTPAAAFALGIADVAKDRHRRYMGATVGAIPMPHVSVWEPFAHELTRLQARLRGGERGARDRVDRLVAGVYGIGSADLRALRLWMEGEMQR